MDPVNTKSVNSIAHDTTNKTQLSENDLLQNEPYRIHYVECTTGFNGGITLEDETITTKYSNQRIICTDVDCKTACDSIGSFYNDDSSVSFTATVSEELINMNDLIVNDGGLAQDDINILIPSSLNKAVLIKCTKNNSNSKEGKYEVVELTEHLTTTRKERKDIKSNENMINPQDESSVLNNIETQQSSSKWKEALQLIGWILRYLIPGFITRIFRL